MSNVIEKTGKTIEEAISAAAEELGVDIEKLDVEANSALQPLQQGRL